MNLIFKKKLIYYLALIILAKLKTYNYFLYTINHFHNHLKDFTITLYKVFLHYEWKVINPSHLCCHNLHLWELPFEYLVINFFYVYLNISFSVIEPKHFHRFFNQLLFTFFLNFNSKFLFLIEFHLNIKYLNLFECHYLFSVFTNPL